MFAKALVIATASALKLQATVELSSLAGVNISALSAEELAAVRAGTQEAWGQHKDDFSVHTLTSSEDGARQDIWLQNQANCEQEKNEDPSYQCGHSPFDSKDDVERNSARGTREIEPLDEADVTPVQGKKIDSELLLAKTGELWNTEYPGCIYTYQYIHDMAVEENPSWGCNAFMNWDDHWLEQVAYRAYYDYYVAPGWISDAYLRQWWNDNIISWRNYLRDHLWCTDDSQNNDDDQGGSDDQNNDQGTDPNNCGSINAETCIWGDNYVVPIKNQGSCGSCYAFSTTQILETYYAIKTGDLVSLSEQQIVDCGYGSSHGCNGGWPASVLNTVAASNNALWPEADYEYTGTVGNCHTEASTLRIMTQGSSNRVQSHSVQAMKEALLRGPLAITVDANDKFMAYSGGVLRNCVYGQLNHAVNAIGWTVMDGVEVVKVRNSWGTWWGDKGYVYIAIDAAAAAENGGLGPCGILEHLYWAEASRQ